MRKPCPTSVCRVTLVTILINRTLLFLEILPSATTSLAKQTCLVQQASNKILANVLENRPVRIPWGSGLTRAWNWLVNRTRISDTWPLECKYKQCYYYKMVMGRSGDGVTATVYVALMESCTGFHCHLILFREVKVST
jgi:hypothetical protein